MSRAAAVSPEAEAGNWYLPHPGIAPWVTDFIEECASFPNGVHDDQVDAWSQGGIYMGTRTPQPGIRVFHDGIYPHECEGRLTRQLLGLGW